MPEPWPPHGSETLPWRQANRSGTREDRMLAEVSASVPPTIADLDYHPALRTLVETEQAVAAVVRADADALGQSAAISRFMIRTESVASSKIERIQATSLDYARATAGIRSNSSATSMVAASEALHTLVAVVAERGRFATDDLLRAHRALMIDDPHEARYAGRLRDMQNWVGGSDHSPRGALHVPPAPERVPALIEDLVEYLNRVDVPVFVQAGIAHAQFESIHPFTDGNGRIGRALIGAVMRRRGTTRNAVVPLASGILARRDDYFDALGAYRTGDPAPIIELFARSARAAAIEAHTTIEHIRELPSRWRTETGVRAGSAAARLLDAFCDHPVIGADQLEQFASASSTRAYEAVDRLVAAAVVEEITGRKRDRVWAATDLIAELDDLDARIQSHMR